jgi:hypothetical protein
LLKKFEFIFLFPALLGRILFFNHNKSYKLYYFFFIMIETRAARYGRNLGAWVGFTISVAVPDEDLRIDYKRRFLRELNIYSLTPRRNGEPANEGCMHELSDLVDIDLKSPEQFARLVKEGIHLMYQKQTSARVLSALQNYLQRS